MGKLGVPLLETERAFKLVTYGRNGLAAIEQPIGWPKPIRLLSLTYREREEDVPIVWHAQGTGRDTESFRDEESGLWMVLPRAFGLTAWPEWHAAAVSVVVALDPVPETHRRAVAVALDALFNNDPLPAAIEDLIR